MLPVCYLYVTCNFNVRAVSSKLEIIQTSFSGFRHNSFYSIRKHEKMKGRVCLEDASYQSTQHFLLSRFVSKNMKDHITNITLPDVLYGCKTWSRILWDEITRRVLENGLLRNTYGLKTQEARKPCKNCIIGSLTIYILHHLMY